MYAKKYAKTRIVHICPQRISAPRPICRREADTVFQLIVSMRSTRRISSSYSSRW